MIDSIFLPSHVALRFHLTRVRTWKSSKKEAPADAPNFCDVYGPGYRPVGTSGTCIKIDGSIDVGIGASSSGGQPSAAASTDWIKTKPAKNGN